MVSNQIFLTPRQGSNLDDSFVTVPTSCKVEPAPRRSFETANAVQELN